MCKHYNLGNEKNALDEEQIVKDEDGRGNDRVATVAELTGSRRNGLAGNVALGGLAEVRRR